MNVSILTETEIETQRVRRIGPVKGSFVYYENGRPDIEGAKQVATEDLCKRAKEMGGDVIVLEPHVELPPSGDTTEATLLMSALVYRTQEL